MNRRPALVGLVALVEGSLIGLVALVALVALAGAACSSGYEVSLEVSDAVNATCNTSCVQSVSVEALGESNSEYRCLKNITMKSLREHGLSGAVDLPVPEDLLGMWVMGWRGPNCGGDMVIFDGITAIDGSSVKVPMKCIASCSAEGPMQIQTTSLLSVAQGQCAVGDATAASAGVLRNSHLDLVFPNYVLTEFFGPPSTPLTSGQGMLARGVTSTASLNTCGAVTLYKDGAPVSTSCVRYGTPGLCGGAGKTEVAYYASPPLADLTAGYRVVGVFAKKNPVAGGAPLPVSGATVTLSGNDPKARVEYLMLDAAKTAFKVAEPARSMTNETGAFAVYTKEPVTVTVKASDNTTVTRVVGGGTVYGNSDNGVDVAGAQLFVPE